MQFTPNQPTKSVPRRGETLIDMVMSNVVPVVGGTAAGLIALELGAPFWIVLLCGFVGAIAAQAVIVGILVALVWVWTTWTDKTPTPPPPAEKQRGNPPRT